MPRQSQVQVVNGQTIHWVSAGRIEGPVMLMLHGFPEFWTAWDPVASELADAYHIVLPDQRGYNLSSKPADLSAYDTKHLVEDMIALIDILSPDEPVVLCGHDWGASVAYALTMRYSSRISHLIIANGVHPICFQKALLAGGRQTAASQYMNVLRSEGVEDKLAANDFEKLMGMLEKFSSAPWLDDRTKDAYLRAWAKPGALTAMLNWYRASPMAVPATDAAPQDFEITEQMVEKYRIPMPHLLLWGMQDTALLKDARADLDLFCNHLAIEENAAASHWILHEQPSWVVEKIRTFLAPGG